MTSYLIGFSVILLHVSAGLSIYVSYAKMPLLEDRLDRCLVIQEYLGTLKKSGPFGRIIRNAFITHAIDDREKLHEAGQVDKYQIEALPKALLLWIQLSSKLSTVSLIFLFISAITIKVSD